MGTGPDAWTPVNGGLTATNKINRRQVCVHACVRVCVKRERGRERERERRLDSGQRRADGDQQDQPPPGVCARVRTCVCEERESEGEGERERDAWTPVNGGLTATNKINRRQVCVHVCVRVCVKGERKRKLRVSISIGDQQDQPPPGVCARVRACVCLRAQSFVCEGA
jgi:hypothetical protein